MNNVISAEDLKIGYSSKSILAKIDNLNISRGEIISIVGQSGVGKTTFLKNIAYLVKPLSGSLSVLGTSLPPTRGAIGYIPQKLGLVNHETVFFNVLEGAICNESIFRSILGFHEQRILDKVEEVINLMNLSEKTGSRLRKMVGQQKL